MKSCLYVGRVRHRRFAPVAHDFHYGLFMLCLDLAELDHVFKGRWLWSARRPALARFDRRDHYGDPARPLDAVIRDLVAERTGRRPMGPIRLLTHLRYFGYCFNPVSFYYCYDALGQRVETIVAEIHNTPWNECFCYVLSDAANQGNEHWRRFVMPKQFHVSPFMDMDQEYHWTLTPPNKRLMVHMENHQQFQQVFDATMWLEHQPLTGRNLAGALLRFPFMTARVILAIYWQALRLRLKGAPFFTHPRKRHPNPEVIS